MRTAVLALLLAAACRHHPKVARRIIVDDTPQGRQCFADAQEGYRDCMFHRVRRGLCASIRDKALLECPGARDFTGEEDPSVIPLPGYRP
ncbi:MAG: hypothetical protein ACOZQL_19440 [Myxococcota bacterium]